MTEAEGKRWRRPLIGGGGWFIPASLRLAESYTRISAALTSVGRGKGALVQQPLEVGQAASKL
eukprot:CAMPEP_0113578368 /NCGR_PEP_ID=MMETSP0015_2-20120614/29444_1 /TAXON_ID=2838 /ORGANISM="Odontella" /LENGTH=62 /DNA_ID=CAMNT_0000482169 /DNA_START=102 /DNA_END=287 /DNA_ORIENTATION=- /assembly_acc=CAM_ASM_000160